MSLEKSRYLNLGTTQEILLPGFGGDALFLARLIPVEAVQQNLVETPDDLAKIFSDHEILYSRRFKVRPYERFAARLGTKQLTMWLLGEELEWKDVQVINNAFRSPELILSESAGGLVTAGGIQRLHLSLAHEKETALAFLVAEKGMPTIVRVGTDICSPIPFESPALRRPTTFTEEEFETAQQQEFPAQRLAIYFAAKESIIKILETLGGWIWTEIGVREGLDGTFNIALRGSAQERLEQMGAGRITTSLMFKEDVGALAFSAALRGPIDTLQSR